MQGPGPTFAEVVGKVLEQAVCETHGTSMSSLANIFKRIVRHVLEESRFGLPSSILQLQEKLRAALDRILYPTVLPETCCLEVRLCPIDAEAERNKAAGKAAASYLEIFINLDPLVSSHIKSLKWLAPAASAALAAVGVDWARETGCKNVFDVGVMCSLAGSQETPSPSRPRSYVRGNTSTEGIFRKMARRMQELEGCTRGGDAKKSLDNLKNSLMFVSVIICQPAEGSACEDFGQFDHNQDGVGSLAAFEALNVKAAADTLGKSDIQGLCQYTVLGYEKGLFNVQRSPVQTQSKVYTHISWACKTKTGKF